MVHKWFTRTWMALTLLTIAATHRWYKVLTRAFLFSLHYKDFRLKFFKSVMISEVARVQTMLASMLLLTCCAFTSFVLWDMLLNSASALIPSRAAQDSRSVKRFMWNHQNHVVQTKSHKPCWFSTAISPSSALTKLTLLRRMIEDSMRTTSENGMPSVWSGYGSISGSIMV